MSKWFYIKEKDECALSKIDAHFPLINNLKSFFKEEKVKNMINNESWSDLFNYYKSHNDFKTICLELLANFLDLCGVKFYLNEEPKAGDCRYPDLRCWKKVEV